MLREAGFCSGIENYSRHLSGTKPGEPPKCLMDYFGDDYLIIIDESHMTIPQIGAMYAGDRSRKTTLVDYGFRLPSALDNRPLNSLRDALGLDQLVLPLEKPYPLLQLYLDIVTGPPDLIRRHHIVGGRKYGDMVKRPNV